MEQKGYQRIELIPLLALIRDHNGDSTVYVYDGNGNLVSKTDADGYVTRYSYTALDLVKKINYNEAKGSVRPDYYKVGHSVDIKNYNLESSSGRRNLVRKCLPTRYMIFWTIVVM